MEVKRRSLIVTFLMLLSLFNASLTIVPENVKATTLWVGGGGPGNYTWIQDAIDDAVPGDSIYVYTGTYYESLIINKTLNLTGEDKDSTIIDAGMTGHVILIMADWVNISGFTFTNSEPGSGAGIELELSENCTIADSIVRYNFVGLRVISLSNNNTVTNNSIVSNDYGILVDGEGNSISGNDVSRNVHDGIWLESSSNNTIVGNVVSENEWGVTLWLSCIDNEIHGNKFLENTNQAFDDGFNSWDNGYPSGGNYWSDYTGVDEKSGSGQDQPGNDGIGDTPYPIDPSPSAQDRYPLMSLVRPDYPRPPTILSAVLSGAGSENVTIEWNSSPDDGLGMRSVVVYEIYRNTTYEKAGVGYSVVASLPNGTLEFVDGYAGEGDPSNYFYQVCAVDFNSNKSCSEEQGGKFTLSMVSGPNLVSVPLIQSDKTIQTVLQTLSYDNAWTYDPINQEWKSSMKSKPYAQSLEYVNHTMGIWVNVTQDSNLTVAGIVPTSTTINLQAGWNLVGSPSFDDNYTVGDLKAAVAVERIEGYDGVARPYFLRAMLDGDFLQAGFGYWIKVENPAVWTVNNM